MQHWKRKGFYRMTRIGALFFLIIFSIIQTSKAQHPDNYFQPADMKRDILWLQEKVLQYHPACIDPLRKDSVTAAFQIARYEAEKPLQELQFLRLLRHTLLTLRCGHSTAIPSKSFYKYYQKAKPKPIFPLQVFSFDQNLFVRFNGSNNPSIKIGDRLTSINQESSRDITNSMMDILPSDGYHNSFRNYHMSLNFPTYYLFIRGPSYDYETKLVDSSGKSRSTILSLRTQGKIISKPQKNRTSRVILNGGNSRDLSVLVSNPSIACLRISEFKGKSGWYAKSFQKLEKGKFRTLILDLRGNAGGSLLEANELLSYLLPDTFSMKFMRRSASIGFNGRSDLSLRARISMAVFRLLPDHTTGRHNTSSNENEIISTRFRFKPQKRNGFKGKLIVLMDGGTFSSASYVAAKLRKAGRAELAGEESGGAAKGCNALITPTITLPETKLRVSLPLYFLDHEMGAIPFRGLQPDYKLMPPDPSLSLKGIDPELEFLARHILLIRK